MSPVCYETTNSDRTSWKLRFYFVKRCVVSLYRLPINRKLENHGKYVSRFFFGSLLSLPLSPSLSLPISHSHTLFGVRLSSGKSFVRSSIVVGEFDELSNIRRSHHACPLIDCLIIYWVENRTEWAGKQAAQKPAPKRRNKNRLFCRKVWIAWFYFRLRRSFFFFLFFFVSFLFRRIRSDKRISLFLSMDGWMIRWSCLFTGIDLHFETLRFSFSSASSDLR